ncbi:MAG: hypothetical protein R3A50_16160 [Saprospiraceae bacterium]
MEQSQLVELIQTLSQEEKDKIIQIAAQKTASQGKMQSYVGYLLTICLNHPWEDEASPLEKRQVFNTIFSDSEFVEGKLEKVMVEAHKIVQSFLLSEYYLREENKFHQMLDFAEVIRLRGLDARHNVALSRLKKFQLDTSRPDYFYFHNQYLLENAIHNHESFHNQVKGDLNIPNTLDALDMHYYLHKLALLNVFLLQRLAANIIVSDTMQERLEECNVPSRYLASSPAIKINFIIHNLLRKDNLDGSDIRELFDQLIAFEKKLDDESLRGFYTYLRNICALILTADSEQKEVNKTLFDLYKDNLKRGYLHYEGKLHPSRYLAISECALKANEPVWAISFINKYKDDIIGENENQDIFRLNMAYYLFNIGKYEDCLDYIPGASPFVDYHLAGKRLELKAYFELNSELLPYKLDAFKMFLSRTSQKLLPKIQRQRNIDFCNFLFQLMSLPPNNQKRAARLVEKLEEKKQASERQWLINKVHTLAGSNIVH